MTSSAFTAEYEFEEIQICGQGLMAWGTATLTQDNDDEFYVSSIVLTGGVRLSRTGAGFMGFVSQTNKELFETIAKQVESDPEAQIKFSEELSGTRGPDPDYERQRRIDDGIQFHQAAE